MKSPSLIALAVAVLLVSGCAKKDGSEQAMDHDPAGGHETPAGWSRDDFTLPEGVDAGRYTLTEEPEDVLQVITARKEVQDGDEIAILGRIGTESPWVEGRGAFMIVDSSLKACNENPGDNCPTPWDYCCLTDQLPDATALVLLVDDQEKPLAADTRAILDVKELSTVVVKGKAQRDDEGNLTILASGVYVKSSS